MGPASHPLTQEAKGRGTAAALLLSDPILLCEAGGPEDATMSVHAWREDAH